MKWSLIIFIPFFVLFIACEGEELIQDESFREFYTYDGIVDAGNPEELKSLIDTQKIHAFVAETPYTEEQDIESLSAYLTSPWTKEEEQVYAIFRWVATNISYNVNWGQTWEEEASTNVLENRTAVCSGYAQLFAKLASQAGFNVVKIEGFSKNFDFAPGDEPGLHAWNAIEIHGKWYLMEPTWAAGFVDSQTNFFYFDYTYFYFATLPKAFVQRHFPYDYKWQLLIPTISKTHFFESYGSGFADGKATFYFSNGNIYTGEWLDGKMNGTGIYTYANGDRFEGEFLDGQFHGNGTIYFADGRVYKGIWENGTIVYGKYVRSGNHNPDSLQLHKIQLPPIDILH